MAVPEGNNMAEVIIYNAQPTRSPVQEQTREIIQQPTASGSRIKVTAPPLPNTNEVDNTPFMGGVDEEDAVPFMEDGSSPIDPSFIRVDSTQHLRGFNSFCRDKQVMVNYHLEDVAAQVEDLESDGEHLREDVAKLQLQANEFWRKADVHTNRLISMKKQGADVLLEMGGVAHEANINVEGDSPPQEADTERMSDIERVHQLVISCFIFVVVSVLLYILFIVLMENEETN